MRLGTFSNAGLGFGLMFSLVDDFTYNARRIERQMQSLAGTATALGASVEASMTRAKVGAAGVLISLAGLAGWGQAAKVDAIFQNYELGFKSFLGTAEEAHRMFEQVKQDAIENPKFSIAGFEKANLMLVSQSIAADKARESVRDLGTILLGVGAGETEFSRMAMTLEKVKAGGILTGQWLRSFDANRVPILKMLDAIGVHAERSKISKAKITFDQVTEAMHRATLQGGQFGRVWEMMVGNVSAKAAVLKENWQATLGEIGKAIRPATIAILDFISKLVGKLQAFAGTDVGKWVLRLAFAFNVLLFGLSAIVLIGSLARVMLFRLASLFPALTKVNILAALDAGKLGTAWGIAGKNALSLVSGIIPLIAKLGIFYLGWKLISTTDSAFLYAIGTGLMFIMGPLGIVASGLMFLFRAFREFGYVMDGSKKPAEGFLGTLQRLGGALTFIGAAWQGFNGKTGEIEVSKRLMQTMDYLGMGDFARKAATWIARIHSLWDGMIEGFKGTWHWFKDVVLSIANFFQPLDKQFASWNDLITKNGDALESWKAKGKAIGAVLAGVLGFVILEMIVVRGLAIINGLIGAASWLLWAAPILFVIGIVLLLGDAIGRLAGYLFGTESDATSAFTGIGDKAGALTGALGSLDPAFRDIGKSWGENLVGGMQSSFGDWWENFASIDIGNKWLWGEDQYHYVPFNPNRSKFFNPDADRRKEISESSNSKALMGAIGSNGGFFSPLGAALGQVQYAANLAGMAQNQVNTANAGAKTIIVPLNIDSRQLASVVVDTINHEAHISYKDPSEYTQAERDSVLHSDAYGIGDLFR